jgi:RNA polymerase sigma-70 factor (ECF subfamily)
MTDPKTWIDAYGDRLFRYALSRVRDPRTAEELVQQALVQALESRAKFRAESSELTWMTGILRFKILEHLRARAKEIPLGEEPGEEREESLFENGRHWKAGDAPRDWGGEPHKLAESAEFSAALRECLDALTPAIASAFVLREMEGVGHREAAETLGVPPGRLAVLLYRARLRLRRCLERGLFAPGSAA